MEVSKIVEIKNRIRGLLPVVAAVCIALLCGAAIGYQYRAREDVYVERAGINELAKINEQLQATCNGQEVQLTTLREQLTQAQELSLKLKSQIDSLTAQSAEQQNLIEKTNRLLQKSAQEEKRTRLRIKRQRNTWEAAAALLACVAIKK